MNELTTAATGGMKEKLIELIQSSVGGCARNWAEVIADSILSDGWIRPSCVEGACDRDCKDYMPVRNYDIIRNMSIDELARKIGSCCLKHSCPCFERCHATTLGECEKLIKEWLESEVQ